MADYVKSIETVWRNCRFRSRLEARWAVVLESLGLKWEYEKEGFNLSELGRYLPDFFLPDLSIWLEIKPREREAEEDLKKCAALCRLTAMPVYMLNGDLASLHQDDECRDVGSHRGWHPRGYGLCKDQAGPFFIERYCEWGECPLCNAISIDEHGQHSACLCVCEGPFTLDTLGIRRCIKCQQGMGGNYGPAEGPHRPRMMMWDSPRIMKAYATAKSARWEHGEQPNV